MNPFTDLLTAFLQGDDRETAALVLADWLDEHDQPDYARYLRLMVMCHRQPDDVSVHDWRDEMDRLQAMRGPFEPREWPLRSREIYRLDDGESQINELTESEEGRTLERIMLHGNSLEPLARWPSWWQIFDPTLFPCLREVVLADFDSRLPSIGLDHPSRIESWDLGRLLPDGTTIGTANSERSIFDCVHSSRPRVLTIRDTSLDQVWLEWLGRLLESSTVSQLQTLQLSGRRLHVPFLMRMGKSTMLRQLRSLDMGEMRPVTMHWLTESAWAASLIELRFRSNRLAQREDWRRMINDISRRMPRLQRLSITQMDISDDGPILLDSKQSWPSPRQLTIDSSMVPFDQIGDFLSRFRPLHLWAVYFDDAPTAPVKLPAGWRYDGRRCFFRENALS